MCHSLKYDLLLACVIIIVIKYIIITLVNGKNALFCWTQIQRSDGGRHILVLPCIPAITYAILIEKSIFLHLLNTAAAAAAHSGRKKTKKGPNLKKIFQDFKRY